LKHARVPRSPVHPDEMFIPGVGALAPAEFLNHFAGSRPLQPLPVPVAGPGQLDNARKVLANTFDLVGEQYILHPGFSWKHSPSRDKEWQIAHHKFYFAVDLAQAWRETGDPCYLDRWRDLIASWLDEMGTGFITASDAQVEAKRVEHWITSYLLLRGTSWTEHVSGKFLRHFLERIARETAYIAANLRPARNHRTFQLYAIFLSGVMFPEFLQATEFVDLGRRLLTQNLLADFGEDGVHIELSSHYHNITLETALAFLELARLNGIALDPDVLERMHRAAEFSLFMQFPDGEIPLFNDSDNGDHLPMLRLAARLFGDARLLWGGSLGREGTPPIQYDRHFDRSGYFVFTDTWGTDPASFARRQHIFYDCATLGEGSHSHYDLFNFCYYVDGRQLVVDPGRYSYSADPDPQGIDWRHEFKSTAYHNTVAIDGRDQTRYLSKSANPAHGTERYDRSVHPKKHGPDVQIVDRDWSLGLHSDWVWGTARSHEYTPLHSRWFVYMRREYLFIFDHVKAEDNAEHEATLRFHLAAGRQGHLSLDEPRENVLVRGEGWQVRSLMDGCAESRIESGWVSKSYGVKLPASVIAIQRRGQGSLVFGSVVAPDGPGFSISRISRHEEGSGFAFEVHGLKDSVPFQDCFVARPDGGETVRQELRYRGRLLAYRVGDDGHIVYGFAARPQRLEISGWPSSDVQGRGHFEWPAVSTR
jgi:heparinase II/III-like protein